jgi:hypothetical protein
MGIQGTQIAHKLVYTKVSCFFSDRSFRCGYIAELDHQIFFPAHAGNKAATHEHDFLSLHTAAAVAANKDSQLQLHAAGSKPPPPSHGLHTPPPFLSHLCYSRNRICTRRSTVGR